MKKGISLIVLVITIIVMIILAAAIIISISNSNVINKANKAVTESDLANVKNAASLKYGDAKFNKVSEYTTASYIETKLIADGVIDEANPYVFTNQGGAFLIPEYDVTSNTKSDYRVINNQLYYFGTDINKRIALKDNNDINTDYITIGFNLTPNTVDPKLSMLTGYDKVKSVRSVYKPTDNNTIVTIDNSSPTGDTRITTGLELYLQNNYTEKLATVVYYGDFDGDAELNSMDMGDITQMGWHTFEESTQIFYSSLIQSNRMSLEEYRRMISILLDIDLNSVVNKGDYLIHALCIEVKGWGTNPDSSDGGWSSAIKDMNFYKYSTIDPYVAEDWESYEEYESEVKYINAQNKKKDVNRAYMDNIYDVNIVIYELPIRVKIFK